MNFLAIENHIARPGEPDLDWNPTHRCAGCGEPCFDEFEHDGKFYCDPCWGCFHSCLYCDELIFRDEVVTHSRTADGKVEFEWFHPNCYTQWLEEQ